MASIFTVDQAAELARIITEYANVGKPPQQLLTEDYVRRLAKLVGATIFGTDTQRGIELLSTRPWLAWVALVNLLDLSVIGFLFQAVASYSDWEDLILPELVNAPTERPGVPPEWMLRRIARIFESEFPVFCAAVTSSIGMGVEEALNENPAFVQLLFLEYVNNFYTLP